MNVVYLDKPTVFDVVAGNGYFLWPCGLHPQQPHFDRSDVSVFHHIRRACLLWAEDCSAIFGHFGGQNFHLQMLIQTTGHNQLTTDDNLYHKK